MSTLRDTLKHYSQKVSNGLGVSLPGPGNFSTVFGNLTKGASLALALVAATSLVVGFALAAGRVEPDLFAAFRDGALVAIAGLGVMFGFSDSALGYEGSFGLHPGLLIFLGILFARMYARRASQQKNATFSPFHFALGFSLFAVLSTVALAGTVSYSTMATNLEGPVWVSGLVILAVIWMSTSLAFNKGKAGSTAWARQTLTYFVKLYSSLIGISAVVALVSFAINPVFAIASTPATASAPSAGTVLAGIGLFLLFGLNMAAHAFLALAGIPVGTYANTGAPGLLSGVSDFLKNYQFSLYNSVGVWAYLGVAISVALVAFISGAIASKKLQVKLSSALHFWQALAVSLFAVVTLTYFANVNATIASKSKTLNMAANAVWGEALAPIVIGVTAVLAIAFAAAALSNNFVTEALPRLTRLFSKLEAPAARSTSARVLGLVVTGIYIAAALTPITAATVNRIWATTSGPVQLGEFGGKQIENAKLKDLKSYLSASTAPKGTVWMSDKVLNQARIKAGTAVQITVENDLGQPWSVGNLDANVTINFGVGQNVVKYSFPTTSHLTNPSWLILHPDFKAVTTPPVLHLVLNPALASQAKSLGLTVNGETVKAGNYLIVPGSYKVKSAGYKLIAATDSTFLTDANDFTIKIGTAVALPSGASDLLNSGLGKKAKTCFTPSAKGAAECFTAAQLAKVAKLESGKEPTKYFDTSRSGFKLVSNTCDLTKVTDKLKSEVQMSRTVNCKAKVTYTEHFYATAKKTVPVYDTQEVCQSAHVSDNDTTVYWNSFYGRWEDSSYWYYDYQVRYEPCWTSYYDKVQTGTETKDVRGAEIGSVTKTAEVSHKVTVTGILDAKDKFSVKN